jgi:hypothetical protein
LKPAPFKNSPWRQADGNPTELEKLKLWSYRKMNIRANEYFCLTLATIVGVKATFSAQMSL